jgi:uncharacterized membrane protein
VNRVLQFCNSYPSRIFVAISFVDSELCGGEGGDWRNRGWWAIDPGTCVQVHSGIVSNVNRLWYYCAVADDGVEWSGDFPTYVMNTEPFDICDGLPSTAMDRRGFREFDVGDSDNFTITLQA